MNLKNTYKPQDIEQIINSRNSSEFENLEFKTDQDFDRKKRADYCAAISNSSGGVLLLGVNDEGKIVGTNLYQNKISTESSQIKDAIKISVKVEEILHPQGRVVIFDIPPHPIRRVVESNGSYRFPKRVGESLQEMTPEEMQEILNEPSTDYTALTVKNLTIADLDEKALENFRRIWAKNTKNKNITTLSNQSLLEAAELINEKGLTRACLILLGSEAALKKYLPCCEIIFEWRQTPNKINYDFRCDALSGFRKGFFAFEDELLKCFLDRNSRFPLQQGLFQNDVWAFNEKVLREAILNAVAHRDYRVDGASIFIKACPDSIRIENPGGLLSGITIENILKKHQARNRLLAEVFQKMRLVERSGQGLDDIFYYCILEGKGKPNFIDTDDNAFVINIPAALQDEQLVRFMEEAINKKQISLSFEEVIELEEIRVSEGVKKISNKKFIDLGLVEKIGHGRGAKYILSHNFYQQKNEILKYTKIVGLSREKNKSLIVEHIEKKGKVSSKEIQEGFKEWSKIDVNNIIQELKKGGKIKKVGTFKNAYWILNNS